MTTLADATLQLAKCLEIVTESVATGGSATTVIDTTVSEPNDYFTNGTIWILSGNNAGKCAKISGYVGSTGVFTFATMTLLNAALDRYAACPPDFPTWLLRQKVNQGIRNMGGLLTFDTSLTSVTAQLVYNLPATVRNVKKLEVANVKTSPLAYADYTGRGREKNGTWEFTPGGEPEGGYTIRLTYVPETTLLTADTDTLNLYYNLNRLGWEAAVEALRWIIKRRAGNDKIYGSLIVEADANRGRMRRLYPMAKAGPRVITPVWS